jgi:hypothetical protein
MKDNSFIRSSMTVFLGVGIRHFLMRPIHAGRKKNMYTVGEASTSPPPFLTPLGVFLLYGPDIVSGPLCGINRLLSCGRYGS